MTDLNDVDVLAPDVLQQLDAGLLVGELDEVGLAHAHANLAGHQAGQGGVAGAPEHPKVGPGREIWLCFDFVMGFLSLPGPGMTVHGDELRSKGDGISA